MRFHLVSHGDHQKIMFLATHLLTQLVRGYRVVAWHLERITIPGGTDRRMRKRGGLH